MYIKKIIVLCAIFYTDFYGAPLESLLPTLNQSLENINTLLPISPEGVFIVAKFNVVPLVDLLQERSFQKLIGWTYGEAEEIFKYHAYSIYINMVKIVEEKKDPWNTVKKNWKTLQAFFPTFIQFNSFEVTDDGSLYASVEFFKDEKGDEKFTLDDCNLIVNELKKLNVTVQCLIQPQYQIIILPPKNKEEMIKNKNEIIKQLDLMKIKFAMDYDITELRMQNGILKRVGGVTLI